MTSSTLRQENTDLNANKIKRNFDQYNNTYHQQIKLLYKLKRDTSERCAWIIRPKKSKDSTQFKIMQKSILATILKYIKGLNLNN